MVCASLENSGEYPVPRIVSGQTATFPNRGSLTNGDGYPAGGWDSRGIIPEPRLGFA